MTVVVATLSLCATTTVAGVCPNITENVEKENTDTLHKIELPLVTVIGGRLFARDYELLSRSRLDAIQGPTLGETLSHIPGIQNSYFGPNAGAPVIRSLSGNRVQILNDGLPVSDLTGISPDMNVTTDANNTSDREVYKGSAAVLYGGKAIGGAVNMESRIVPRQPARPVVGTAGAEGGYNIGARQFFTLDGAVGSHWAWHLGASNSHTTRVRIPGDSKPSIAYDPKVVGFDSQLQAMAQVNVATESVFNTSLFPYISRFALEHMEDYELSEEDKYTFREQDNGYSEPNIKNPDYVPGQDPNTPHYVNKVKGISDYGPKKKGEITNSHASSTLAHAGVSYTGHGFRLGAGYQCAYSYYGIPAYAQLPAPASDEGQTAAESSPYEPINVRSLNNEFRIEAEADRPLLFLKAARWQMQGQYAANKELIGSLSVSNLYTNSQSMRLELPQKDLSFLSGLTGAEYTHRKMKGSGANRFLPDNFNKEWGVFTRQQFHYKSVQAVIGYRHDFVTRKAFPGNGYVPGRGMAGGKLSPRFFSLNQVEAELKADLLKTAFLRAVYSHSERAPEVNELYAGNNHYAIAVEENGDDRLNAEMANTVELEVGLKWKGLTVSVDGYRTYFNNYIYLAHTGISRPGGFTVKEWRAADTQLTGLETTASYSHDFHSWGKWELGAYYDLVKNKNVSSDEMRRFSDGDYMPNMPTSRLGAHLTAAIGRFAWIVRLDRYLKQHYLGKNINDEYAFPAYSLLSARCTYRLPVFKTHADLYLYGNNLLNQEARPQNSLLKYLAPLPGISIGAGVKVTI